MKRKKKTVLSIIGMIAGVFLVLLGSVWYATKCRYTDIDAPISPDDGGMPGKENDLTMIYNYKIEQYRYLTDSYFSGRNRLYKYEENKTETGKSYPPVIVINLTGIEDQGQFCSDVVNWLLYVQKELPYEENETLYQKIKIAHEGKIFEYQFQSMHDFSEENISDVYNHLYDFAEEILAESYKEKIMGKKEVKGEAEGMELTDETIQSYLSLEPDCSYKNADGVEYRMIPIDRASGSSYYALIATADGGKSAIMVNTNPHLGSGGEAKWISFLQDGQTGFSCLTYSGGMYGRLYRTEDGGRSFEAIEYPSAKAKFSDETYYNPFVVPEKVYEKDGKLYMEVGQGTDGDYYGEEGFCNGLYESGDGGKIWAYVKEISVDK